MDDDRPSPNSWLRRLRPGRYLTAFTSDVLRVDPTQMDALDRIRVGLLVALMALPPMLVAPLVLRLAPCFFRRDLLTLLGATGLWTSVVLLAGRPLLVPSDWRRTGWFALPARVGVSVLCGVVLADHFIGRQGSGRLGPVPVEVLGGGYGGGDSFDVRDPISTATGGTWTHVAVAVLLVVAIDLALLTAVVAGRSRLPSAVRRAGAEAR